MKPPSRSFTTTFARTLTTGEARGILVNVVYVAAIAIEHNATVVTFDRNVARFSSVTMLKPEATLGSRGPTGLSGQRS